MADRQQHWETVYRSKAADRARYVVPVLKRVKPGGPLRCSGLDMVRYAPDALHTGFGAPFRLHGHETEIHRTCYCVRI